MDVQVMVFPLPRTSFSSSALVRVRTTAQPCVHQEASCEKNIFNAASSRTTQHVPLLSIGPLQAISEATQFKSPFGISMLEPTSTKVQEAVQSDRQERLCNIPKIARNATLLDQSDHGLGSWIITTDQRKSRAATEGAFGPFEPPKHKHSASRLMTPVVSGPGTAGARKHSLLALTLEYTRHLHFKVENDLIMNEINTLRLIKSVFTPRRMTKLELRGFKVEDVACWGWVLASDNVEIAISRFYSLRKPVLPENTVAPLSNMPFFMFTLILRSRHISAPSLGLLVKALKVRLSVEGDRVSALPDATTTMILLVRLVRHARRVAPGQLIAIAHLAERLLKAEFASNATSLYIRQRLCYNYNRMLSFLSIPTSQHPFRSIPIQQLAQFRIIRQMASMEPALPVTREGFQALAKVQLAHKKTPGEKQWAQTKADSWPPWREDKLGISADVEYPGSQSRAAEVLRRQTEAGYVQTSWDLSARILAGWDMDKSPTIQTRSLLPRAPLTFLQSLRKRAELFSSGKDTDIRINPDVWAARISATRTIREAWGCFCAYDTARPDKRSQEPYHAMFLKLVPGHKQADPAKIHLPGDGKEVMAQSTLVKDHLFVPVEPPSFHAFYKKLQIDGIRPAGALLVLLLDNARTNREGIELLYASKLSEIKRDVLLNAHKYHIDVVSSTLKSVQSAVVASYFRMLWRTRGRHREWYKPASRAAVQGTRNISARPISAQSYVLDLLDTVDFEPHVYNSMLEMVLRDLGSKSDLASLDDAWIRLHCILDCMKKWYIKTDMATFYNVTSTFEYIMDANPEFKLEFPPSLDQGSSKVKYQAFYGPRLAKILFLNSVVYGRESGWHFQNRIERHDPEWLPYEANETIVEVPSPAALHLLMRFLAKTNDALSIITLLRWMNRFATDINAVSNELGNGHRQMRFALCVAAMAIEDFDAARDEDGKIFLTALDLVNKNPAWGGWPRDEELERYLVGARVWDERQRRREQLP